MSLRHPRRTNYLLLPHPPWNQLLVAAKYLETWLQQWRLCCEGKRFEFRRRLESAVQPNFSALERHRKQPNGRLAAEWCAFSGTGNQKIFACFLKFQGPKISFSDPVLGLQKTTFSALCGRISGPSLGPKLAPLCSEMLIFTPH